VVDTKQKAVANADIIISDKNNAVVQQVKTDGNGNINLELPEYTVNGSDKKILSPYTLSVKGTERIIELNKNTAVKCMVSK